MEDKTFPFLATRIHSTATTWLSGYFDGPVSLDPKGIAPSLGMTENTLSTFSLVMILGECD